MISWIIYSTLLYKNKLTYSCFYEQIFSVKFGSSPNNQNAMKTSSSILLRPRRLLAMKERQKKKYGQSCTHRGCKRRVKKNACRRQFRKNFRRKRQCHKHRRMIMLRNRQISKTLSFIKSTYQ